jgi:Ca2+-binding RTX toxin-like protein
VKTLWEGDPRVEASDVTLAAADGDDKLIIHTLVQTGLDENRNPKSDAKTIYDDTSVYDPQELSIGRQTATAHLEGGILRISGTIGDDRIRLWRSQRMPGRLVVEYNGNERSFPFSSIRQINVDLQDGNDYFQILEGEGQIIRTKTSILGGDGSDTIYGATGHDTIYGGNSGDRIYGRGNDDVILGGGGRDRINAGAGADEVSGGSGVDSIVGGSGVDVYFGQTAVERIFGENVEGTERDDDVFLG